MYEHAEESEKIEYEDKKRSEQRKVERESQTELTGTIAELKINKLQPKYPMGELKFMREALETNHTSQTHFTDPGAEFCYRRPLCGKLINKDNLATCIRLYFNTLHYDPRREYNVIVNGKADHQIVIQNLNTREKQGGRNAARGRVHSEILQRTANKAYEQELPRGKNRGGKKGQNKKRTKTVMK